ncbi:MAG: VWA domain-containing protein [Legionella sp.]|nr:MAG: VWA domain-containing protein [Legionella sp.]
MRVLNNDVFRSESMEKFLTDKGMDLNDVKICSVEGLFGFSFTSESSAQHFATRLTKTLESTTPPQTINLATIIENEIEAAQCSDATEFEMFKESCRALFPLIKKKPGQFYFSPETGEVTISLPVQYVPIFNSLNFPHMKLTAEGKLSIDIKTYIKDKQLEAPIIQVTGLNANQLPLVFLNSGLQQLKKSMFYAQKRLADNTIEVTPYFFVPTPPAPPTYHFVLDVSTSMRKSLPDLKKSAIQLAEQLFVFQPEAQVELAIFSRETRFLGTFTKKQLEKLINTINRIQSEGDTHLYETILHFFNRLNLAEDHHNILLFSDGKESSGNKLLSSIRLGLEGFKQKPLKLANNKFYVFAYNYEVGREDALMEIVNLFDSKLFHTSSADFVNALENPRSLQEWAASRGLFQANWVVKDANDESPCQRIFTPLDMSGQLASLPARKCKVGDQISLEILDSNNNLIVKSNFNLTAPPISNAQAISTLGVNASNLTMTDISNLSLPTTMNASN